MYKKIICFTLAFLFISLFGFVDITHGATTYYNDFENSDYGALTYQYDNGFLATWTTLETNNYVDNTQYMGSKSYRTDGGRTYMNFTYSENTDITNITFWLYINADLGGDDLALAFYTDGETGGYSDNLMIFLELGSAGVNSLYYYDHNHDPQLITGSMSATQWSKISVQINANDSIDYHFENWDGANSVTLFDKSPYNVLDEPHIEHWMINHYDGASFDKAWWDEINITTGTISGTDKTQYSQSELNEYTPVGPGSGLTSGTDVYHCGSSYSSPLEIFGNRPYIEQQGPHIAGIIRGFDLYTNEIQYDLTSTLTDYELYINGIPCGNPSYFFESGDSYILRWVDFEVNCTNEAPVIEIAQDTTYRMMYVSFNYQEAFYWFNVGTRVINPPSGFVGPVAPILKNHGNVNLFGNNVLDGSPLYASDFPCMSGGPNIGLFYTIYYEEFEDLKIIDYPDLEDSLYARMQREYTTYPCYISATVEQMASGNAEIELAIDNTTSTSYSFPVLVDKPKFYYDFVPTVSGYYVFNLTQGGSTIATDSIYVNDIYNTEDSNYLLWTIPPRNGRTGFTTHYHYDNDASLDGVVAIFKYKDNSYYDMNDKKVYGQLQLYHALKRETIESNGNGSFIFSHSSGLEKYDYHVIMFVKTASGSYEEVKRYVHEISSPYDVYDDYVYVYPKTSYVSEENPVARIKISGQHSLYGSYVYLQINNNTIADLSYNDNFEIYYQTANGGSYYVTVVQRTGTIWNVLANNSFIVIGSSNIDESENVFTLPKISSGIGFILGLIVTMISMLIPLMLVTFINAKTKTEVKIPVLVFGISGGLGIAVSVGLGFFPFWIVPFITMIGIIIVAIFYVITKKGGDGGE